MQFTPRLPPMNLTGLVDAFGPVSISASLKMFYFQNISSQHNYRHYHEYGLN